MTDSDDGHDLDAEVSNLDEHRPNIQAALRAYRKGYMPVPIRDGAKRPWGNNWQRKPDTWSEDVVRGRFLAATRDQATGIGLALGELSNGLIDVDIDHPLAMSVAWTVLPTTSMRTGRAGSANSHFWFRATGEMPTTRRYKMPDRSVSVELRSTNAQTIIPPTIHPSGEPVRWEGDEWADPTEVDGRMLAARVAMVALLTVLREKWPSEGSRHDAYLALAGSLLRYGEGVHPIWRPQIDGVIGQLAIVTHDEEGTHRANEVVGTTIDRLSKQEPTTGWPSLAEIIGDDHAEQARRLVKEIEQLAGFEPGSVELATAEPQQEELPIEAPNLLPEHRNPVEERRTGWSEIDLEPYMMGEIVLPEPTFLLRSDGSGLVYPGKVCTLVGASESMKTWLALYGGVQEIQGGGRVLFIDLEDDPALCWHRLRLLGMTPDDVRFHFKYVMAEGPLSMMERSEWGRPKPSQLGQLNQEAIDELIEDFDPTYVIVDGTTGLYQSHHLKTIATDDTEVIARWLRSLCVSGGRGVLLIDHTAKSDETGVAGGSQHKVSMIQGVGLGVKVDKRPAPGRMGRLTLYIVKDRIGTVRGLAQASPDGKKKEVVGTVTINSTDPGLVEMVIDPPSPDDLPAETTILHTPEVQAKADRQAPEKRLGKTENLRRDIPLAAFGGDLGLVLSQADIIDRMGPDRASQATYSRALSLLVDDGDLIVVENGWKLSPTR